MDTTTPELEQAMLAWVNKFNLPKPVETLEKDLQDGRVLWQILVDIDPDHFIGQLPEPNNESADNWIPRWQNLKHVDKAITTYLREVCDRQALAQLLNPDLKAIAIDGSKIHTTKLLKATLLACVCSPKGNERMVTIMGELGAAVATPIARMIEEINLTETGADQESTDSESIAASISQKDSIQRDPELEREELLIKANREIKRLQGKLSEVTEDLDEARARVSQLEEEVVESRLQLDRGGRIAPDDDELAQLRHQTLRDRDYIAQLESDMLEARNKLENQERKLERLKSDATQKQDLRDELQLMTAERDELAQKAKANENLRKKIQVLQEQQKAQQTLQEQLAGMTEDLQELETLREQVIALRKANEENMETIANGEQEIFDQKTARKRLEHELKFMTQRWEQAKEMSNRYQEASMELEAKVRELEDRSAGAEALGTLEDQLNEEADESRPSRKSMLGIENADVILLHQKVELLTARCQRVEEKYLDVYQENLGLQSAIQDEKALEEGSVYTFDNDSILETVADSYRDDPFVYQTNKLHAAEAEVKELTSKVHAVSAKNMELQHQLAELTGTGKTDGAGADHQTLKENYEQLLSTHEELQKHAEKIDTELDDQKALLRHKLLNPDVLRQEDASILQSNEYKLILEQLGLFKEAPEEESEQMKNAIATDVTQKLQGGLADLSARDKRIAEQESLIKTLKQNAERMKKEAGDKASVEVQKELQALQRENKLIMGAWYDMANRLQSNTVVLQRTKNEAPKSWLGRQRMEVTGGRSALGSVGANIRR